MFMANKYAGLADYMGAWVAIILKDGSAHGGELTEIGDDYLVIRNANTDSRITHDEIRFLSITGARMVRRT